MLESAHAAVPLDQRTTITAGAYTATVSGMGAALVDLRHGGRALVYTADGIGPFPRYRGAVLAPWPNRIADGRYTFDGQPHQLPVNEVERNSALHGLVLNDTWLRRDQAGDTVAYLTAVSAQPGYPFTLDLRVEYHLDATEGLRIDLSAVNTGDHEAPYGASIHPYLTPGDGVVDDWTFHVAADQVLTVDELLLPVSTLSVVGTPFDFRATAALSGRVIDHALTGLHADPDGHLRATLLASDGRGVCMTWTPSCPWLQVHTTDLPGSDSHRRGLAVEPMTCPPDAFNSGQDLRRLVPGGRCTDTWWIAAI